MKKVIFCVGGLALSCTFAASVFAGAVENKTNWSAEYIRTLNRNAATDFGDIAAYNPAGTVKLDEGFIVNGSVQYLSKDYKNVVNGTTYESDEPSWVPGVFGIYNKKKWSVYGVFNVVGGGGEVDFSNGDATTVAIGSLMSLTADRTVDAMVQAGGGPAAPVGTYYAGSLINQKLTGKSYLLGYALGGAYSFTDKISASIAIRYVDAHKNASGTVTAVPTQTGTGVGATNVTANVDYDQDDGGWGGIFGLNLALSDALNVGARFESKVNLDLKAKVNEDDMNILPSLPTPIIDGKSVARDLPSLFAVGVSYHITPKLRTEVDLTYYFNEDADWAGAEKNIDNGYDIGIALEYQFNDKLLASIGYLHTELGVDPANMLPENPELDANSIGAGIAYAFTEKFHTNFSIGNSFYEDDSYVSSLTGAEVKYEKNVFFLAMGLEYRFQ